MAVLCDRSGAKEKKTDGLVLGSTHQAELVISGFHAVKEKLNYQFLLILALIDQ